MELNQEYYADYGSNSYGGLTIKTSDLISNIVPKMRENGLTRLDPSNIWALNHGCPFIGSGGGAKSIAGTQMSDNRAPQTGVFLQPYEGTTISGGEPVSTTGEFQTYSAIRWIMRGTYSGGVGYRTMGSDFSNGENNYFITSICMKHLIAVPRYTMATVKNWASDIQPV